MYLTVYVQSTFDILYNIVNISKIIPNYYRGVLT